MKTYEQQARDLMERCGDEEAQGRTAGDVCELANLLVEVERFRTQKDESRKTMDLLDRTLDALEKRLSGQQETTKGEAEPPSPIMAEDRSDAAKQEKAKLDDPTRPVYFHCSSQGCMKQWIGHIPLMLIELHCPLCGEPGVGVGEPITYQAKPVDERPCGCKDPLTVTVLEHETDPMDLCEAVKLDKPEGTAMVKVSATLLHELVMGQRADPPPPAPTVEAQKPLDRLVKIFQEEFARRHPDWKSTTADAYSRQSMAGEIQSVLACFADRLQDTPKKPDPPPPAPEANLEAVADRIVEGLFVHDWRGEMGDFCKVTATHLEVVFTGEGIKRKELTRRQVRQMILETLEAGQ